MIYGLTFDRTMNLPRIIRVLKEISAATDKRLTVRLICDEPESGFEFEAMIEPVKQISVVADVMVEVLDSYYMSAVAVKKYEKRVDKVLSMYGEWLTYVECGNEVAGDWLGDDEVVHEKVGSAIDMVKNFGKKAVVTYYLDGANPDRMLQFADAFRLTPDLALISWYPGWTPRARPDWGTLFVGLMAKTGAMQTGFGEFGPEPLQMRYLERSHLISDIHAIRPALALSPERFIGGGFYWNAWPDLISGAKSAMVKAAIIESWRDG